MGLSEVWQRSRPEVCSTLPKARNAIKHCNRCRFLKHGHKWQQKLLYTDVGGLQSTWLKESPGTGPWGLQCKICHAAAANPATSPSPYVLGTKGAKQSEVSCKAWSPLDFLALIFFRPGSGDQACRCAAIGGSEETPDIFYSYPGSREVAARCARLSGTSCRRSFSDGPDASTG